MKIYELDEEIVVDSIPSTYDPKRKIFLTTLVHIEMNELLPKVFSKIYTSDPLKTQLQIFLRSRDIEIPDDNFHVWKPFEPEVVTLSNGTVYEVLPCCPEDTSTSMLLIFRQDSFITHVYVGLCSELRSTLLNTTFITWLKTNNGRTSMYVPYSDACKRCVSCEYQKAFKHIEEKINENNTVKLLFQLPLFGSESFIAKITSEFPRQVALCGLLKNLYMNLPSVETVDFADSIDSARFIITSTDVHEFMAVNLEKNVGTITENHQIKWSPLPSVVELSLLSDMVQPKRVYGITFKKSHSIFEQPVKASRILSAENLTKESIQRKSTSSDKCCLEESERIQKEVITNLRRISQQSSQKPTIKQENLTEQTKSSSERTEEELDQQAEEIAQKGSDVKQNDTPVEAETKLVSPPNQVREDFNDTPVEHETKQVSFPNQGREDLKEAIDGEQRKTKEHDCHRTIELRTTYQNTIERRDPSTNKPIQKPTTSAQIIVTEFSIKIPRLDLNSLDSKIIVPVCVQQSQRSKLKSITTSSSKDTKCYTNINQKTKDAELQSTGRSPRSSTSSLVYRKGKRGIGFVDEDSSSSGVFFISDSEYWDHHLQSTQQCSTQQPTMENF